jgi:putative transposase
MDRTPTSGSTPRPAALVLAPGETISIFERNYKILTLEADQVICTSASGDVIHFKVSELVRLQENVKCQAANTPHTVSDLLLQVSEKDLKQANERFDLLKSRTGVHQSTLSRYARKVREAEAKYGLGYFGLISDDRKKGNRVPRYTEEVCTIAQEIIREKYLTKVGCCVKIAYGHFRNACKAKLITSIPSRHWFRRQINQLSLSKRIELREGHRAAYQNEPALVVREEILPKHGDFPWASAQIDHTLGDIELLSSETGRNLGRPWISLMICSFSRKILAVVVNYDQPSFRTCLLLIQECLKKHHRLPEAVVVDNGAEFESTYFTTILGSVLISN